jgi:type I restriction enzyme, S subunit
MNSFVLIADALADATVFTDGDWIESKDQDPDGDVRLTQLADVGDGVWINKSSRFLTSEKAKQLRCTYLEPGDLLVARMPDPLGRCCVFPGDSMPCVTVVDVCVIRPNQQKIDQRYLMQVINSPHGRQGIARHITGTTRQRISRKNLGKVAIPLPALPEQKRIAKILDAADALRTKRRESIAQLDTLLQSTFLDMFGDPVTNPMGWTIAALADFCKTGTGGTPSRREMQRYYEGGTIPWVKSGELREEVINETGELITEEALKETNVKLVPKEALLLALYGATVGRLGILGIEATTNQAVCHIIPDSQRAVLRYMFHVLSNQVTYLVGRGVGGAQPNISQGIVKALAIPLPPLDLQCRFATIVESVEQQKATQHVHLDELDTLFASLQQRAFNGSL